MTQRFVLDEIVDPFGATVVVERDPAGRVLAARFDLTGLPRVDALLAGRPVAEVPSLVEHLCGICPAAHHLAGVRALEALAGLTDLPDTARAVRRLLHHGSALQAYAPRLLAGDRDAALALRRFGTAAMAAAGSPGHFPVSAVPGGVRLPVTPAARDALARELDAVLAVAVAAAERQLADPRTLTDSATVADSTTSAELGEATGSEFSGADVALVTATGSPDVLGEHLRAVCGGRAPTVVFASAPARDWDELVAEECAGAPAPRPYLRGLGPADGRYRVGPVAQLRIGPPATPVAAQLRRRWLGHGGAGAARAIMTVHAVEAIAALLDDPALTRGDTSVPARVGDGVGVGWVDGPRGLLVHRYQAEGGLLVKAQILTPTAQNEPWLAELLTQAAAADAAALDLEDAIRETDPCLPCSSAPPGAMGLLVESVAAAAQSSAGGQ